MEETKLLIKVCSNGDTTTPDKWVHLCYIDPAICEAFMKLSEIPNGYLNEFLSKWCKEDIGKSNPVKTMDQLTELKQDVKELYKSLYPELYRETDVDRQGWMRAWVTKKMKETIENGEKCI